jgi:hypothetical protein
MKSDFSYGALLAVHPAPGESSPFSITCPSCGAALRVTAKSRFLAAGLIICSYIVLVITLWQSTTKLAGWQVTALVLAILAAYYLVAWPLIVRFKPWSPFQYWLPKSRLVGYFVYLIAPLGIMASLFFLAAKFKL